MDCGVQCYFPHTPPCTEVLIRAIWTILAFDFIAQHVIPIGIVNHYLRYLLKLNKVYKPIKIPLVSCKCLGNISEMFLKVKVLRVSRTQWPHFALCFLPNEASSSLYKGHGESQVWKWGVKQDMDHNKDRPLPQPHQAPDGKLCLLMAQLHLLKMAPVFPRDRSGKWGGKEECSLNAHNCLGENCLCLFPRSILNNHFTSLLFSSV